MRALSWILSLIFATTALAQSNTENVYLVDFTFPNPGARAVAMGGAFVAVADDATAALTNPAGLPILTDPEFTIEYSATHLQNRIDWNSGNLVYSVTIPENDYFGFRYETSSADFPSSFGSISYASFVYPFVKNKFTVSGFYNQPVSSELLYDRSGISIIGCDVAEEQTSCFQRVNHQFDRITNSIDLRLYLIGIAAGYKPLNFLYLGVGFHYYKLDLSTFVRQFGPDNFFSFGDSSAQILEVSDTGLSANIGLLVAPIRSLSLGVVFNKRPEFSADHASTFSTFSEEFEQKSSQTIKVPDSYSAGISWAPSEKWLVSFELQRIQYSQLMNDYFNGYFQPNFQHPLIHDPQLKLEDFQKTSLTVKDATQIHLGGERTFLIKEQPVSLRLGYWNEPYHGILQKLDDDQLEFNESDILDGSIDLAPSPYHSRSLDEMNHHFTLGAGIVRNYLSIDVAFDYSKKKQKFLFTTNFYF